MPPAWHATASGASLRVHFQGMWQCRLRCCSGQYPIPARAVSQHTGTMPTQLDLGWLDPQLAGLRRDESGTTPGLCRAISSRTCIDVVVIRVIVVCLTLCAGLGLAIYAWGVALTPGPRGTCPIDALVPGFRDWTIKAQKGTVLVTTLIVMILARHVAPLPWAVGLLAVAWYSVTRRRSQPRQHGWVSPGPAPSTAPRSDEALVAQWREEMRAAARPAQATAPQPPAPRPSPRPTPRRETRPSWGASCVALAVAVGAGLATEGLLAPPPLVSLGAGLATAGLAIVLLVVARGRRLPRLLAAVLAVSLVPAGWLAIAAPQAVSAAPAQITERVVADSRVVDLSSRDLAGVRRVHVTALAADVTVVLPAPPRSVTVHENLSEIKRHLTGNGTRGDLDLQVDATASNVTIRVER